MSGAHPSRSRPSVPLPFEVRLELDGWRLLWARLALLEPPPGEALSALSARVADQARERFAGGGASAHPTVAAVRKRFRAAGCDPTRHRPSSEALLRRLLKGEELPAIHPLVDLNNCLSVRLLVPCCVMTEGTFRGPITLRAGREGEEMDSLRGRFHLGGKPLMADPDGPFGTPITDSERIRVTPETRRAWLVAYLPDGVVTAEEAGAELARLLDQAPVATLDLVSGVP